MSEGNAYVERIRRIQQGVEGFAAEMRRKDIHVGLGSPPRCVTCGLPWRDCQAASRSPSGSTPKPEDTEAQAVMAEPRKALDGQ